MQIGGRYETTANLDRSISYGCGVNLVGFFVNALTEEEKYDVCTSDQAKDRIFTKIQQVIA